ncbi:MAG: glycosyltransferase [Candidatus Woesebacteria bacterium]|nr:MAG: glycosyltransferase [Candidatus Woesebacteria bacterium]
MKKNIEVSVIVGHYGRGSEVYKCLDKLKIIKSKFKSVEFILVDNNDAKLEKNIFKRKYSWVKYIPSPKNLGWGAGRNLGIKHSTGKYIFSIDSDILIDLQSFNNIYDILKKDGKIGMVIPRIKNISGRFTPEATKELTPVRGIFFLSFINKIFPRNYIVKDYLMNGWNRQTSRKVDVGQLGAFMIKKVVYDKIGKFDENLFLYFEENDISKRLKKFGYGIYFDSKSEATHLESKGTPKSSDEIKNVFAHSRYHYFKKHYGIASALLVEIFARFSKNTLIILGIFLLGIFLRFYRLVPNLILNGEMGTDYMNVWNIVHGSRTFLIGPRTSHEWFFISPLSYWIYAILLILGKYNPIVINVFWAIVGSSSILVSYYYLKKLFNEKIALISSFLLAVSPAWIMSTRDSRYNAPAGIIFFPYLWYLFKSIKDRGRSLGILGFILGISMSFFPSPLLLIPAMVVCFIYYKIRPKLKYVFHFILGFLIPNITFIIYEMTNRFTITLQLLAWIPYRVIGFFGLYPKNNVNSKVISQNVYSIYQFFKDSFVPDSYIVSIGLFALMVVGLLVWVSKALRDRNKEMSFILLFINLVVVYLGLFIHGDPPEHYFLAIFPIPLILLAFLIIKTFKDKFIVTTLTILIGGLCLWSLISSNWFYQGMPRSEYIQTAPPYSVQLSVVGKIIKDSEGSVFSISRIGVNDKFENEFANNYIYLLTIRGAKIKSDAGIGYTIVEERNSGKIPAGSKIWADGGVWIYKSIE